MPRHEPGVGPLGGGGGVGSWMGKRKQADPEKMKTWGVEVQTYLVVGRRSAATVLCASIKSV